MTKKTKKQSNPPLKKTKTTAIAEELQGLIEAARIEIENEYIDDLRDDPDA